MRTKLAKLGVGLAALSAWILFVFDPLSVAGTPEAGPPSLDHSGMAVASIAGRVLAEDERLRLPSALELVGDRIVLGDGLGDHALHVLARRDGAWLSSFGRRGEGPGEYSAVRAVQADGADAFRVFDIELQRLSRVALDDGGAPSGPPGGSVALGAGAAVTDAVWLEGSGIISLGFFPDSRLAVLYATGEPRRTVAPLPPNPDSLPPRVLQQAYQGRLEARPDGLRLAAVSRHADLLEIFDAGGRLLHRVPGPFGFEPKVSVQETPEGPLMATGDDLRFGYLDLSATERRIYALFSGRTRKGFPERANYGRHVHLFDWSGGFLGALALDHDAFLIAVDEGEGALYAVRHLPTPAVLRYALPDRPPRPRSERRRPAGPRDAP